LAHNDSSLPAEIIVARRYDSQLPIRQKRSARY
jgi:hypothetical protein